MNAVPQMIPAFDPDGPDAQMLEAFERVRATRAFIYGFDERSEEDRAAHDDQFVALDDGSIQDEKHIQDNVANTLPGVIARLMLLIPGIDTDRWVDRGLMQQGFLALYRVVDNLDGHARQIARAAHELIEIDWQQSLTAYEKSTVDFEMAVRLKSRIEGEYSLRPVTDQEGRERLRDACAVAEALEVRLSNEPQIRRLVRTLTPDHAAYLRKVSIITAEQCEDVTLWLARDTNYLVGRIDDAEPLHEGSR